MTGADFLHRSFLDLDGLEVKSREGRVSGLCVPYNRPTEIQELVEDGTGGPRVVSYREQFAPGSMERAARAPNRVMLQFTHSDAFGDQIGYGVSFRDSEAGSVGEFQLYRSTMVQAMERLESSHRGLSLTFASLRPAGRGVASDGDLVTREAVMCRAVAAVTDPAYADAGVLELRAVDEAAKAAAEAATLAEQQRQAMTDSLQWLTDQGRELSPGQQQWLAAHGITLRQAAR